MTLQIDLYFGPKYEQLGAKRDFRLNSQYNSATGMLGEVRRIHDRPRFGINL
jgi:hypothetical protein